MINLYNHFIGYDGLVIEDCNLQHDSSVSYALNHLRNWKILRGIPL